MRYDGSDRKILALAIASDRTVTARLEFPSDTLSGQQRAIEGIAVLVDGGVAVYGCESEMGLHTGDCGGAWVLILDRDFGTVYASPERRWPKTGFTAIAGTAGGIAVAGRTAGGSFVIEMDRKGKLVRSLNLDEDDRHTANALVAFRDGGLAGAGRVALGDDNVWRVPWAGWIVKLAAEWGGGANAVDGR
ncbi:MAG: hypothetical protein LBR80_17500 [Deltaproteobacteria bacterium]|jgi:hypothetical protein|nr:hypothetical protein [Deltaproteobacteria bacterium]